MLFKTTSFLIASCFLLISATSISKKDEKPPANNIIVTLNVNTGQIAKPNVNPYCNFGQPSNITNENYTISANVGDNITWQGVSSSAPSTDIVNITSINYQGGTNVFGKNVLNGNGENPEKVVGLVTTSSTGKQDCKYTIKFTVLNNGKKRNGTFQIDPRIAAH